MMRGNRAKHELRAAKIVVGTMLTEIRSPEIPRALAASGLDFIFIDTEHSAYDLLTVTDLIRAGRSVGLSCYVRVSDVECFLIARTLDAGAHGIMVPRIETREQIERLVAAAKYPPKGERGYGVRSIITDFESRPVTDWIENLNEDTLIAVQIESKRAIDNIEELVSVEGVDAAIMGPMDLSISLGVPGQLGHPMMVECISKVVQTCERFGVAAGTHVRSMDMLGYWRARGMRFLTYSTDVEMLMESARNAVRQLKG